MHKRCKCGKRVEEGNSTFTCNSCTAYNKVLCSKPRIERRNKQDEIHFAFSESWLMEKERILLNTSSYGHFTIDHKDKTKFAIWICLFNFLRYPKTEDLIQAIVNTINHEEFHKAVYSNDFDLKTTKAMDSSNLMKKLTEEDYL